VNIKGHLKALLHFYLYSDINDEKKLDEYLEENGIDFEAFRDIVREKIRHKKAELLIKDGREFSKNYIELLVQEVQKSKATKDHFAGDINFALAYRKKTDGASISGEPDESDSKKLDLIRKAKEKSKN
jgi:hypothetical protein